MRMTEGDRLTRATDPEVLRPDLLDCVVALLVTVCGLHSLGTAE